MVEDGGAEVEGGGRREGASRGGGEGGVDLQSVVVGGGEESAGIERVEGERGDGTGVRGWGAGRDAREGSV